MRKHWQHYITSTQMRYRRGNSWQPVLPFETVNFPVRATLSRSPLEDQGGGRHCWLGNIVSSKNFTLAPALPLQGEGEGEL